MIRANMVPFYNIDFLPIVNRLRECGIDARLPEVEESVAPYVARVMVWMMDALKERGGRRPLKLYNSAFELSEDDDA